MASAKPQSASRRLVAAGVIATAGGTLVLLAAILTALVATQLDADDACNTSSGFFCMDGSDRHEFVVFAIASGLVGSALVTAGVAAWRRTRGGQFALVILGGVGASLVGAHAARAGGTYVLLLFAYLATVAVLAGTGTPRGPQERRQG